MSDQSLASTTLLTEILHHHDSAVTKARQVVQLMGEIEQHFQSLDKVTGFKRGMAKTSALHRPDSQQRLMDGVIKDADCAAWIKLLKVSQLPQIMNAAQVSEFRRLANTAPIPFTAANAHSTFSQYFDDRESTYLEGLVGVFKRTSPKVYKSQSVFEVKRKLILPRLVAFHGPRQVLHLDMEAGAFLRDIERYCWDIEGLTVPKVEDDLAAITSNLIKCADKEGESRHFYIKWHLTGTVHLTFKREEIRRKVNERIAEYYGSVIPEGAPVAAGV